MTMQIEAVVTMRVRATCDRCGEEFTAQAATPILTVEVQDRLRDELQIQVTEHWREMHLA